MELALLGREPVRKDRPAGSDVKYDDQFDELQSEVAKAISVVKGAGDWEKIVALSSDILAQKSKDIIVAGYLAVALVHTRKAKGLMMGSQVYLDIIENYWENLYPSKLRPRGRSQAIAWWIEKTAAAIKTLGTNPLSEEQADQLCSRLEKVQRFLKTNLDDCPSFRVLIESARPVVSPLETSVAKVISTATPQSTAPTEIFTDTDAHQSLDALMEQAGKISTYLFSRDATNPLIYRLNRLSLWFSINELPPANDGRTLVPPPEKSLVDRFSLLQARGDQGALLKAAEDEAFQNVFWFDLHRFSAEALKSMKEPYAAAAESVCRETARFLFRLPGVEQLSFSDGRPFADEQTLLWLREINALLNLSEPTSSAVTPASSSAVEDEIIQKMKEINQLLRAKKITEAVRHFQDQLRSFPSGREKFLWKLEFTKSLMKSKQEDLLAVQLDQILEEIDRYHLDEFDPALTLRGLTLILDGYRTHPDPDSRKKTKEVLHRLAKFDLTEFLRQGNGSK